MLREPDPSLTALSLEGVSKRFHRGLEEVVALDEVDLQVAAGEFLALVGPSGSGKSTLLHIAGGLDRPDSGRVLVGDDDLATLSAADRARLRRRRVGFVFQFFHLIPTLSVAENVALPLTLDRARRVDAPVLEMLDRVGLAPRAGHLPGELSGGEMQRAAIARALVSHPALILADEPTGNLDSATGEAILDLMTERVRETGAALLMVTHDLGAAARADRSLSLRDGRVSAAVSSPGPGARSRGRTKGATTGDDAVTGAVTGTLTGAGAAAAAAAGAEPVRER